jgi:hypothetical protein
MSNYEFMRNLCVTITVVILATVVAEILVQSVADVVDGACSKDTGLLTSKENGYCMLNLSQVF